MTFGWVKKNEPQFWVKSDKVQGRPLYTRVDKIEIFELTGGRVTDYGGRRICTWVFDSSGSVEGKGVLR